MSDTEILLAVIGGAHGIKGEVRVKSFTDNPLAFGDYGKLHDKNGNKYAVLKARVSKTVVVTRFKSIDTREKAEALNGIELFVERDKLPEVEDEDDFYISDLIGCDVNNEAGEHIGTVLAVPDFGAGNVLEISPLKEGGGFSSDTYFLPFTKEVVPHVDLQKWAIVVVPPKEVSERDEMNEQGDQQDDV